MKIKYGVLLEVTNEDIKNGTFTIPDSVTSIGDFAFRGCKSLKSEEKIYKAFKPNLSCRDYQYKIKKWSDEIEDIKPYLNVITVELICLIFLIFILAKWW